MEIRILSIQFQVKTFYVFPFDFLTKWKIALKDLYEMQRLKRKFNKLNWTDSEAWRITSFCGSLDDAVGTLCSELTKDYRLHRKLKPLILSGYDRQWK